MANVGIVICSRRSSSRIPDKPFVKFNEKPLLEHLIRRVGGIRPVYIAVPQEEWISYSADLNTQDIKIVCGYGSDPLGRMAWVARQYNLDAVVRITHDKIFIDRNDIEGFIDILFNSNADYVYSSDFIPGTGFEVIRNTILQEAASQFKDVEHISYAIRAITDNVVNVPLETPENPPRLLIDYPEDVVTIKAIFSALGDHCTINQICRFCKTFPSIKNNNKLPDVTVYTCAYNAEKWINECVKSVLLQQNYPSYEYIAIDDGSTDSTSVGWGTLKQDHKRFRPYIMEENKGLSSCSNAALSMARGEYIIRLDADDRFSRGTVLSEMVEMAKGGRYDVVYPSYYDGSFDVVTHGRVKHHVGGALFNTRALNFIKFTEGLRHHDSFDLWTRLEDKLKVGYLDRPTFFYRHTKGSMSRSNHKERERIKNEIRRAQAPCN